MTNIFWWTFILNWEHADYIFHLLTFWHSVVFSWLISVLLTRNPNLISRDIFFFYLAYIFFMQVQFFYMNLHVVIYTKTYDYPKKHKWNPTPNFIINGVKADHTKTYKKDANSYHHSCQISHHVKVRIAMRFSEILIPNSLLLSHVYLGMHTFTSIFAEATCNPDMHLQLSLISCTTDLSPDLGQLFWGI